MATTDTSARGVILDDDGVARCSWAGAGAEYRHYHDTEWGLPVSDDIACFEKLSLEGFQAGLSWLTILRKRPAFRSAFADFRFEQVAGYDEHDVERLLDNAEIVRHRAKIEAVINNAGRALELVAAEGSLARYLWRFAPAAPDAEKHWLGPPPSTSAESEALSKDLKRRGWRFIGPTTAYAFMQAMGLVNDHRPGCDARAGVEAAREAFNRP